jgi:MFS family permease
VDYTVRCTLCRCEVSMPKEVFCPTKDQAFPRGNPALKDWGIQNRRNWKISRPNLKRGLRDATLDGSFYSVMTSLTNGVFLTGFALALGSSHFEIGVIASLPLLAPMLQLPASPLLARRRLKRICLWTSFLGRSVWVPIALLPLIAMSSSSHSLVWTLIFGMAVYHISASIAGVSWISWMADLVPEKIRGRYFGNRNVAIGAVGMIATLGGGLLVKRYGVWFKPEVMIGFTFLFLVALVFGYMSIIFLRKIPFDPGFQETTQRSLSRSLSTVLVDKRFLIVILFSSCWGFGVNLASPFFTVYMFQDLHLGYETVAIYTVLNLATNLLGMWFWGRASDRYGNKPVMQSMGLLAAMLPFLWVFVTPVTVPYLAPFNHLLAGFCWAGINLTSVNLLLKLARKGDQAVYLSVHAFACSLFIALGPLAGGMLSGHFSHLYLTLGGLHIYHLHFVFIVSTLLRYGSLILLQWVHEPKEVPASAMIKALSNIKRLSTMMGLQPLVHPSLIRSVKRRSP